MFMCEYENKYMVWHKCVNKSVTVLHRLNGYVCGEMRNGEFTKIETYE